MNVILLSGGTGKKLWPLSNNNRSKQFYKIFKNKSGKNESMIQRINRQIKSSNKKAIISIASNKSQISILKNQLGNDILFTAEPERKDTFPAVLLNILELIESKHASLDDTVIICSVDLYVEDNFFNIFKKLDELSKDNEGIILLGNKSKSPSILYSYIVPENNKVFSKVKKLIEKPSEKEANKLYKDKAYWNAGIYATKASYLLELGKKIYKISDYDSLYASYDKLNALSLDKLISKYNVPLHVYKHDSDLIDIGTWDALSSLMDSNIIGNGKITKDSNNVNIINDLDIPILVNNVSNVVIAASQQGILISNRNSSTDISKYVDNINQNIMFAEKSWGELTIVDVSSSSLTISLKIKPGHQMSYHSHENRDEMWVITAGKGKTIVDGMMQDVKAGDVITMQAGCRHTIIADKDSELYVTEVQLGDNINVNDKKKYELE